MHRQDTLSTHPHARTLSLTHHYPPRQLLQFKQLAFNPARAQLKKYVSAQRAGGICARSVQAHLIRVESASPFSPATFRLVRLAG